MAEDDNKNNQTNSAGNVPADKQVNNPNPQKKRPRRRKRKPNSPQQGGDTFKVELNNKPQADSSAVPSTPKKKKRRRPKKSQAPKEPQVINPEKSADENLEDIFTEDTAFAEPESVIEPEPKPEPAPELAPEPAPEPAPEKEPEPILKEEPKQELEEAFLASDDNKTQPEPEQPVNEQPEEPSAPPPPLPETEAEGPVGWDQLKDAIKKDYEASNEGVTPVPAAVPEVQEEEPTPEVQPVAEERAEIVEPVPVIEEHKGLGADEEAEKKEIIRIITKYSIGGCAIIAIIAGIFLFQLPQRIFGLIEGVSNGEQDVQQEQVQEEQPTTTVEEPSKSTTEPGNFEEGVGTAIVAGESIPKVKRASTAIQVVYKVGLPQIAAGELDIIAGYMTILLRLQNAFTTDIHQLLDNSTNRAQALQIHLSELNVSLDQAKDAYSVLSTRRDELKEQFNEATTEKNTLEEEFFTAINSLKGNESNKLLVGFIDTSARQVDLRAQYNALSRLQEMYETAIANMEARIKDIELNKSALISGVKVVDIKGSDLELIIQEEEL